MSSASEWFRSAEMEYISIVMQENRAYRCLARLGRLGAVQFTDLNPHQAAIQRRYIHEVQRCDTVERKLNFFESLIKKYNVTNEYAYDINTFLDKIEQRSKDNGPQASLLQELETLVEEKENELRQLNSFRIGLLDDFNYQVELKQVLEKSREFLGGDDAEAKGAQGANFEEKGESGQSKAFDEIRFKFLSGTVDLAEKQRFERMIFRSTRGNCLLKFSNIDPEDVGDVATTQTASEQRLKTVFIVFYQANAIEEKIKRVCEAFSATLYSIPDLENTAQFEIEYGKVQEEITDRESVLAKNFHDIEINIKELCKWLEIWKWTISREKSVFHTMNYFAADVKGVLRAEGWVVASMKPKVQQLVYEVHSSGASSSQLPSSVTTLTESERPKMPPTYFKTNKFTSVFQVLVDTYGIPRYREANPSVPNVIMFPFLFGVMFGDIGHGILLLLFALFVVYKEDEISKMKLDEMSIVIFSGRYFMVLMGFFSLYCGILYNDYFAMGLELFDVSFAINDTEYQAGDRVLFVPIQESKPYPVGIDPTWHHAENGLLFFNSVKMKMAVIFGVTQMTVGLVIKLLNGIHFRSKVDIWFEAIPQIIFLVGLFGYMCFLIVLKWCLSWRPFCTRETNCNPPSIITTMIEMFLNAGTIAEENLLYEGQATVQTGLLLLVLISVPWMLIPKPLILGRELNRKKKARSKHKLKKKLNGAEAEVHDRLLADEDAEGDHMEPEDHEEEETAGDLWMHQGIETIEFCLGGMSNTASYLRLWALSLAHSQLGLVFLDNTLLNYITDDGIFGVLIVFGGYAAFAAITFAVLLVMDNLECFLHALRLHWVEFQSKFYKADGIAFAPLDFVKSIKGVAQVN